MALTGRKRVFADAVLAGLTNKKAAIKAQYSEATASAAGSRLVKDKAVVEYLAAKRAASATPPQESAPPVLPSPAYETDPMRFLERQMNDDELEMRFRIDVAKALMPFKHTKLGEGGKKDQKQAAAEKAGTGKFGLRAVK
ncbi:MAG TPA: terminase small subunit [Telluria sp.]|jgi:phage terminase small subunit